MNHLSIGNIPNTRTVGKEHCLIRDYCKQATIAMNGVLLVREKADSSLRA